MPWARFHRDFDWEPKRYGGRVCTAYKAGMILLVVAACLKAAVAAGSAEEVERPTDGRE